MGSLFRNIFNVYRDPGCAGFGHSYLLKRRSGNILLPRLRSKSIINNAFSKITSEGGIAMILVTDYHFAGQSCERIANTFEADIFTSTIEKPKLKKNGLVNVTGLPYERQFISEDLEVVPLPGQTSRGVGLL